MLDYVLQFFLFGLILLCCAGGIWAQIKAKKHILPGREWALRKDSLMQRRDMAYDAQGMGYVKLQKALLFIMFLAFILLGLLFKI